MREIGGLPDVQWVMLRGSGAKGEVDRFSDIDLLVEGGDAVRVLQYLNERFGIVFFDWATSLIPDEHVVTVYLKNASIFWNVDVQFVSASVTGNFVNHPAHHLLKLWILNLKYLQRGQLEKVTVEKLARKSGVMVEGKPYALGMREIFEHIQVECGAEMELFLRACEEELGVF